ATTPRTSSPRCDRAEPRPEAAGNTGRGPRGSRSRTGRATGLRLRSTFISDDEADHVGEAVGDLVIREDAATRVDQRAEERHLQGRDHARIGVRADGGSDA